MLPFGSMLDPRRRSFLVATLGAMLGGACGSVEGAPGALAPPPGASVDVGADLRFDGAVLPEAGALPDARADVGVPAQPIVRDLAATHRAIPGVMFGGWGPHLGHLVHAGADLWFVDDACDATLPCDVNVNRRLDYHLLEPAGWAVRTSLPLPAGVQQNTGTIAKGGRLFTYGIDTASSRIVECTFDPVGGTKGCVTVPIALPASTNYIGAALAPAGHKMLWATTVKDGGGGSFHWFADYGGGWNGPRTGGIGGYNDASYAHVAFFGGASQDRFVLHAQLVGGLAPAWSFVGAFAEGDVGTANPVAFTVLASPPGDPVESTNDVAIDPGTGDVHLFARTRGGAIAYFHRKAASSFSAPTTPLPRSLRARLVLLADRHLAAVYSPAPGSLAWRVSPPTRPAGAPIDWASLPESTVALPAYVGAVTAIYPAATMTEGTPPLRLDFAVVGAAVETRVAHVHIP
jgi:hypothetical protein